MERERIASYLKRERITALLTGLRRITLKSLIAGVLLGIASFVFAQDIIKLFLNITGIKAYSLTLPEAFFSTVELALYGGVFFALPVISYLIWHELKGLMNIKPVYGWFFILASILLFYGGSAFCYFIVLPSGIKFLVGYEGGVIKAMISVERFVRFCTAMIFAFAVTFEIPIIMMALARMGIVKSQVLSRTRRFAILFIAVAAAVITPTPDVYNMMLLSVPMYILYEVGIILMKIVEKRSKAADRMTEY